MSIFRFEMKNFCSVFLFILFWCGSIGYKYETYYMVQKVDHFSYANNDTFRMRVLINDDYFQKSNGSVLFYTGNEGDIEMFANNTGFIWENAKYLNALIVFAEHRYYGKSLPYGNASYQDNSHLGYLTSEQALADFASLIEHLKVYRSIKAPFIAIGGSYGGMLAAWMRIKYPHLIAGAYASSAPVLMFPGLNFCGKLYEIITKDFRRVSLDCEKSIRTSWNVIRKIGSKETGYEFLTKEFNLCKPLNSSSDIDALVSWLVDTWFSMAMLDYPYPTNFLLPLPGNPVKAACASLRFPNMSDHLLIKSIVRAASVYHNHTGTVKCFDIYSSGAKNLGETGWDYQSCTEMVCPLCQNGKTDMFEPINWNFTDYTERCWKRWKTKPDMYKALYTYGGRNIQGSSNIIFSNGDLDPWSGLGILSTLSPSLIAIYIQDAAHHLDLRSSNPADPLSVIKARKTAISVMKTWINNAQKY